MKNNKSLFLWRQGFFVACESEVLIRTRIGK